MAEDIETAKEAALLKASKYIANCLTTPDQLDKVEQIRRKVLRNKAAVDSRLKTAVQSQIDGIRSGLKELQSSQDDIAYTRKIIGEISHIFKECEPLNGKLRKVQIAHEKYAKLEKTNSHLKLIFNVPQTIKRTEDLIKDGKLLQAHKNIMELESTRDELLLEVYKISQEEDINEPVTKSPLYMYFSEVEKLSEDLCKQIMSIIERTLSFAHGSPTELVTSLRIIEREERSDRRCIDIESRTKFMPPGRPKSWKYKCTSYIKKSINNRFDGNQLDLVDRVDKMWLVKHLERMRLFILEDLITVKHLVRPCFPPSYNIFKVYIVMYHEEISRTLEKFALEQSVNKSNECVTLLQWITEYGGPDLLGHEELKEHVEEFKDELEPILSRGVIESLMEIYVKTTDKNVHTWLQNMSSTESQDWYRDQLPESDSEGYYRTALPIILFQMLDQNLQVGAFIEKYVKLKILDISVKALVDFVGIYKVSIIGFKDKHYLNRTANQYFEPYMVSISNNCQMIAEFSEQMKNQHRADLGEETFTEGRIKDFNDMISLFEQLSHHVCDLLLDGVFLDLEQYFQELLTKKWLGSAVIIDTVIATLEDYANDYVHLKPSAFHYIMEKAVHRVVIEYVRAALHSRHITFRNSEERIQGANQITDEAKKIAALFTKLASLEEFDNSPCSILAAVAEVLRIQNTEIVSFEVMGLANKYKDFRADHALALLTVRGDMGRNERLQLITDLKIRELDESIPGKQKIFGEVIPSGSMLDTIESRFKK